MKLFVLIALLGSATFVHAEESQEALAALEFPAVPFRTLHIAYSIQRGEENDVSDAVWCSICDALQQFEQELAASNITADEIGKHYEQLATRIDELVPAFALNLYTHVYVDAVPDAIETTLKEIRTEQKCTFSMLFVPNDFTQEAYLTLSDAVRDQFINFEKTQQWNDQTFHEFFAFALNKRNNHDK